MNDWRFHTTKAWRFLFVPLEYSLRSHFAEPRISFEIALRPKKQK